MIIGWYFIQFEPYICLKITKFSNVNLYLFIVISLSLVVYSSAESKCVGHNSHGNCYLSPNSQGTLPQHPWDPFLFNLYFLFTPRMHPAHPSKRPMGPFLLIYLNFLSLGSIHGSENHPCFTALHFTTLHLTSQVIFKIKKK